jgi:vacuolar-type H+-ATPase subunit H
MKEETITRILHAEQNGVALFADAQREIEAYLAETRLEAQTSKERALSEARQQAQDILDQGRKLADSERANLIAHAGADAQGMETLSTRHFDEAVQFVLLAVTGQQQI